MEGLAEKWAGRWHARGSRSKDGEPWWKNSIGRLMLPAAWGPSTSFGWRLTALRMTIFYLIIFLFNHSEQFVL
ncbi:MAG: hypothetical protein DMG82_20970 [Acidobacteria bacterium]|nr:MAG: hypothetical protein DMG82_20970 [Acidobacteriota bacterium]PYX40906.1 MAG: hypothetical protein DMG83_25415 [Acidobacteriota bacterium]